MKPRLLAFAVLALALTESALAFYRAKTPVPDADWGAAAARVRGELKPDDLVVSAPAWTDPLLREHLGDRIPVEMAARSDADRYARIWELSIRGGRAEETTGRQPSLEEHFGKVTLRRYDKPSEKVVRDFTTDFGKAHVSSRRIGKPADPVADEHPCTQTGTSWRCGGTTIEPRVMEIDYRPRRGILAPAIADQIVSVVYDDVEGPGVIVGYAGLHDYYARKSADTTAFFRMRVDSGGHTLMMPLRNDTGWKRFELPLPPGKHTVSFETQADNPQWRFPGFHAEVRPVEGAP